MDKYDYKDTSEIMKKFSYLNWCPHCYQLSGECYTFNVRGCHFDENFVQAVIGITYNSVYTEGSPIIRPEMLKTFINLVINDEIILNIWCPCPGFCPLYSICKGRNTPRTISIYSPRGNHDDTGSGFDCCKFKPLDLTTEELNNWKKGYGYNGSFCMDEETDKIYPTIPKMPPKEILEKSGQTLDKQLYYARNNILPWPF